MLIKKNLSNFKLQSLQPSLRRLVAGMGIVLLLAGCAQAVETPPATIESLETAVETAPPASVTPAPTDISSPATPGRITRMPPAALPTDLLNPPLLAGTPTVGFDMEIGPDHPAVQASVKALSDQFAIQPGEIELTSSVQMEWPDSCLGLAGPGEMCLQVITPGYRVVLRVAGKEYAFRTDASGGVVRMEVLVGPVIKDGQGS